MPQQKPPPSPKAGSKGARVPREVTRERNKSGKDRAADPPPSASPKAVRAPKGGGGSAHVRNSSQHALEEAQLANDRDLDKTPPPSSPPPRPSRASKRAKKADEQRARKEARVELRLAFFIAGPVVVWSLELPWGVEPHSIPKRTAVRVGRLMGLPPLLVAHVRRDGAQEDEVRSPAGGAGWVNGSALWE